MIYFDSAATTLQKPKSVSKAVAFAMEKMASSGRGDSSASLSASEVMLTCRETAAKLFGVPEPEQVVFTFNATHGLNIAIKSLVKSGQRVLISGYEHNAVSRPIASIPGIEVLVLDTPLFEPEVFVERLEKELRAGVDVVICTHVSNVFGYILPVDEVAHLCREWNVPLIVDASQAAGTIPINMEALQAAFIAMPGHKGLYGPQGTGLLLCGQKGEPLLHGGTGSLSFLQGMPDFLPDRLEAGTHNVSGIAGLLQGLRFVEQKGETTIFLHEHKLKTAAAKGLSEIPGIEVFYAQKGDLQAGVLSFRMEGHDCAEVGEYLSRHQIAVRTGLHCAPLAHQSAGTEKTGTVRLSFSAFNHMQQLERFLDQMRRFSN
ncbi:MAG: cysteine desulfurase [Evtepia sp.]|nr:cysteine desulfurase [Evtepia sp.]